MAACDVFCLPSHSEGCPNVIVEARACGRPVVATNVGGIPEITTPQSAILVPPGSPVELAKCLLEALNRDWNPIQIAAGLSPWDEVSKQSFQVCEEAMAGFRRPEIT
jgi:glycosyltransferase involved in cell wall biosynthesis